MAPVTLFITFVLTNLALLHSAEDESINKHCPPYFCNKKIGSISFPFRYMEHPHECGLYSVDCPKEGPPMIRLKEKGYWHEITSISNNTISNVSVIIKEELQKRLEHNPCDDKILEDLSLPIPSPLYNVSTTHKLTLLNCRDALNIANTDLKFGCSSGSHPYYYSSLNHFPSPLPWPNCSVVQLPLLTGWNISYQPYSNFDPNFTLEVTVSEDCYECHARGGICQLYEEETICTHAPKVYVAAKGKYLKLKLGLGIGLGVPTFLAACFFILWCYSKKYASLNLVLSRNRPDSEQEGRCVYLGVPVFTYKELEEATNHFDCQKEIGDGGFGIVYHGKLKDGREVAVKRLYEHNYKRAEQFMNEIEILTHLRHKNLVTLYGCTSRHSRDLLLVYEYIANGTVADHLHGDRAAKGLLTWPIRMSIAIETAIALCYLHASDIVHRDVKTTNILLDINFTVKVADFGISRLFPLDATHVSTAPQGTAGYVDPEYHQCYQLTPKSDVYSFGVVFIELISSLPAVDITRHRRRSICLT